MDAAIERALELMAESQRMVALTGAGIRTPSGVPVPRGRVVWRAWHRFNRWPVPRTRVPSAHHVRGPGQPEPCLARHFGRCHARYRTDLPSFTPGPKESMSQLSAQPATLIYSHRAGSPLNSAARPT
mgnify:CR=1 FL=1